MKKLIILIALSIVVMQSCKKEDTTSMLNNTISSHENSFIINGGKYKNQLISINPTASFIRHESVYYPGSSFPFTDLQIANDSVVLHFVFDQDKPRKWDTSVWPHCYPNRCYLSVFLPHIGLEQDSTGSSSYNFIYEVKRYDSVGGYIEGTFSGNFKPQNSSITYTITDGKFSAIRQQDQ